MRAKRVLDVFSRRITGWMMSGSLRTDLVLAALEMAVHHRDTGTFVVHTADESGVIHHSDYAEVCVKPRIRGDGLYWRESFTDSAA
jgi:transposase InsO family protein